MKKKRQRIEVYLPKQYNPDSQGIRKNVPAELLRVVKEEVKQHFSELGVSFEFVTRARVHGEYKGIEDRLLVVTLDTRLKATDFAWIRQFKEKLKRRFEQEEIYIVYYDVFIL